MQKGKLSTNEGKVVEALSTGTYEEVKALLAESDVRVNCLDETGMTFLQHAAFRGKADLCGLLLAQGGDVNSNHHDNNYSTLMFAAISGNTETTRIILEAGANINHVNNLGRTATQMAAFVGQHQCVTLINNFVPVDELEYYTQPQGLEKEGKLKTELLKPLYTLLNFSNLHPVLISKFLDKNRGLLESRYNITKILDQICEQNMKSRETNDVKALKTHYMSALITRAGKVYGEKGDLDSFIKMLVKGRDLDGFPENMELFIRGSLKEFPYMESQLLQQMVRQISPVVMGNEPTALSVLMSAINGQQFFKDEDLTCTTCGDTGDTKNCSACKMVRYCNQECQKLHWRTHKNFCKDLAVKYKKLEADRERLAKQDAELKEQERLEEENRVKNGTDDALQNGDGVDTQNNAIEEEVKGVCHNDGDKVQPSSPDKAVLNDPIISPDSVTLEGLTLADNSLDNPLTSAHNALDNPVTSAPVEPVES